MSDQTSVLNELVGEGKKFQTPEDLAKGKKESDAFIVTLQNENKELRTLVTDLGTKHDDLKQKVEFLSTLNGKPTGDSQNGPNTGKQVTTPAQTLTVEDVSTLFDQRENQRKAEQNQAQVDATLVKQFGAEATNFVKAKAAVLGLTVEQLRGVAQQSPLGFYNLVGISPEAPKSANMPGLNSGSHTTTVNGNTETTLRGQKWWENKRKEVGSWKFATNVELNKQMHMDITALGDAWESN